jgi:S-adenosylmethionine hydrolase
MPGLVNLPEVTEAGAVRGQVWWVDRFGNCQLNIDPEELQAHGVDVGGSLELRFGEQARMARWVHTYADAKPSELVVLVDSYGLVSIALDRRSAAAELDLRAGSGVTVVPPPGGSR